MTCPKCGVRLYQDDTGLIIDYRHDGGSYTCKEKEVP